MVDSPQNSGFAGGDRQRSVSRRNIQVPRFHASSTWDITSSNFEASGFDLNVKVARPDIACHPIASNRCSRSIRKTGKIDWKNSRIRSWRRAMIRRKPSPPSSYLATPPPETSPRSSTSAPTSEWDADDEETMSTDDLTISRPHSAAGSHVEQTFTGPYAPSRPTLPDVLSNAAPPPWTLSAFTAYLSQNHCLENLEFTMDADRYRERFDAMNVQMAGMPISSDYEECNYLRMLWQRLLDAYIIPDGSREINIPSNVRETLLSLPNDTVPPRPEELEAATKIIYNLMEESVLVSFLNDVPPTKVSPRLNQTMHMDIDPPSRQSSTRRRPHRSRSRRRQSPSSSTDMFNFHSNTSRRALSQTSSLTVNPNRTHRSASHLSSNSGDASLTDDSASASSPGREPMTPPTTPPSSDIGGTSPKNRSDNAWKKMMVWKKKSNNGIRDTRFARVDE